MLKTNIKKFCADTSSTTDKCKKIFITSLHFKHGGVEMVISSLANALVEKGYDVEILCIYRLGEPAYFFDDRIKITYLTDVHPNREEFKAAIRSKNPVKIIKEAFYAIKVLRLKEKVIKNAVKNIYEGVVISTRHEHSVLLSKYGNKGVLKIAQLHSDHNFEKKLLDEIKHKYENIDYFTLLTEQTTNEIKNFMQGYNNKTKCITIPNFLSEIPELVEIERKNQVVSVGRLSPEKGFSRLLDVWALFSKEHPDWTLKIIGDGEERSSLETKANELGISNSVVFTGMLPHETVLAEMMSSQIYAMTSFTEALPMVIIEAASCGIPAVAFDVRVGPIALIKNNETGILIEDSNINEFSNALSYLADNSILCREMGENARENSYNYSKEKVIYLWEKVIKECY